jgi:hypothetical protein
LPSKSTPFLKFFLHFQAGSPAFAVICFPYKYALSPLLPEWFSVKSKKFAQKLQIGNIYGFRKSRKYVEGCHLFLCKSGLNIHRPCSMWITPVDKLVDNVENSGLSTGIPLLSILSGKSAQNAYPYV